jgi:enoyl-CoA hydratase
MNTTYTVNNGIARVVMGLGGPLNVLSGSIARALQAVLREVAADPEVRVVILRGNERAFVGGADIKELEAFDPAGARDFITALRELFETVRLMPVPTIAAVNGYCLGAGFELAAVCDFRIGTEDSFYGMPEVTIGMPSVLHGSVLASHIGEGRSRWLLLTGAMVDVHDMEKWGFIYQVVAKGELDAKVDALAEQMVRSGEKAMRLQKQLITYWEERRLDLSLDFSTEMFARAFETDEPQRFITSFLADARARKTRTPRQ